MADERHMITFEHGDRRFNMRVVAIIFDREEKRVLINRAAFDEFWVLPGGRAELGESAVESLAREMQEELGVEVQVGRLLWVAEEFFESMGKVWHGLGLYFHVTLPPDCPLYDQESWSGWEEFIEDFYIPEALRGTTSKLELLFRWYDRYSLHELPFYPRFLMNARPPAFVSMAKT